MTNKKCRRPRISPILKFALDLGPLAVFFIANARADIFVATGAFMVAILVSLVVTYSIERRLPLLPVVTALMVLAFGSLTLILNDETFIKLKPTIANVLIAAALFIGLAIGKPFLKVVLGTVFELDDEGWRKLTWRWAWFFLFLAVLNEIVWRNSSTDVWVNFKVFGIMPLTILFSLSQLPMLQRYKIEPASDADQ
ncbi:MAG: septation protein A [Alphaproteobacteria bacterium]|nr:septation protein A [Alphaproteobacteria bacterium]